MNGLVHLIQSRSQRSCALCGVSLMVSLAALGLGFVHLWGHS